MQNPEKLKNIDCSFIFFYGTLLSNFETQKNLNVAEKIELVQQAEIEGELFSFGEWPGLFLGNGRVSGELYKIKDPSILGVLDKFENYFPEDEDNSEYIRKIIRLLNPEVDAWVYILKTKPLYLEKVKTGSWLEFKNLKKSTN